MGSISRNRGVNNSDGARSFTRFSHVKTFFSYKEIYTEQPEIVGDIGKVPPVFKAGEEEFTEYELLQNEEKNCIELYSNIGRYGTQPSQARLSSLSDLPDSSLHIKREHFYARYLTNYQTQKGSCFDSKF